MNPKIEFMISTYFKLKTKLTDRQLGLMKTIYYKFKTRNIKRKMKGAGKFIIFGHYRINGPKFIEIEDHVFIYNNCWLAVDNTIYDEPSLIIEHNTYIGDNVHIHTIQKVLIKNNVLIANNVYISDNSHEYIDIKTSIKNQPIKFIGEVIIGENSWIGENVCIIGAKVGKHCVIGANSVVTMDIPDYSIAVGSPAKIIKSYNFSSKKWELVNNNEKP